MDVDVVIIGGGPAGITAGTVLQRYGYKTCIIDCQFFPREKLCAGVLTTKSIKLVKHIYQDIDLNALGINYINTISLFYKNEIIGKYRVEDRYGVIERKEFDNELLQHYIKLGGLALEGQKDYKIFYYENRIALSRGEEINYQFLIGADGVNSKVSRFFQHRWKVSVLCFEKFISNESEENSINIYFGKVRGGYCWRIPGNRKIGIGLGEFYIKGGKRTTDKYRTYFKGQGVDDLSDIKGAFVPIGSFVKKPVKNNVLLVGDAAGLIDTMTGEGIYFAIESGRQAALSITDFYKNGQPVIKYLDRIKKIHKKMREQNIYNKFLYVPILQRISMKYMKNNTKFVQEVLDNAISSYGSGYTKEFFNSITKK